jgi:hypothetical protein
VSRICECLLGRSRCRVYSAVSDYVDSGMGWRQHRVEQARLTCMEDVTQHLVPAFCSRSCPADRSLMHLEPPQELERPIMKHSELRSQASSIRLLRKDRLRSRAEQASIMRDESASTAIHLLIFTGRFRCHQRAIFSPTGVQTLLGQKVQSLACRRDVSFQS